MHLFRRTAASTRTLLAIFTLLLATTTSHAQSDQERVSGPAFATAGQTFATWSDYYSSDYFEENGKRCGKPATVIPRVVDPGDCTYTFTNPSGDYIPGDVYQIPVVVHIIENTSGDGAITDQEVQSQIDVLNEDFRAIAGTPGAPGYDTGIEFVLASTDPMGNPTNGITRSVNNTWFADNGAYYNSLAWDTANYMNIYTNQAGGALGYVPDLPQGGIAGSNADRVVVLWSAFGRNSAGGPPYDQGRTATHEVGHYLGLEHTFTGGCASASSPACYSSGDLICDTNSESQPNYGCPGNPQSCGSSDPIENYMDYSDDTCMDQFTMEQAARMRCSLLNYRADLWSLASPPVCGNDTLESGEECDGTDSAACQGLCQVDCTCPAPVCGNNVQESGEDCDGTADGACEGLCLGNCTCPAPVCGNNVTESGEDCDGTSDAACPGLCEVDCMCPIACNAGDLTLTRVKIDFKKFLFKGTLANDGTYDGMDPRDLFEFYVEEGGDSITASVPSLDAGWAKSKPEKGKYKWKGLIDGLKIVKLTDLTAKKGYWKVIVKGKEVPGADLIDAIGATVNVDMTFGTACGSGTY